MLAGCSQAVTGSGRTAAPGSRPTSSPAPGRASVDFGGCDKVLNTSALPSTPGLDFTCATLAVPLDYGDASGKTISLVLLKVHSSANTDSSGSLLVNPGGPGGSGVQLAAGLAAQLSGTLLKHFDLIGFDPRGVGLSSPIRCISDAEKDTLTATDVDVTTTAGFAAAKHNAAILAQACTARYGSALAQYNTVNTARDMDRIRIAVGDPKLTYLGFSYGTELGAQYVHLFPNNLRAVVLDGAVDPLTTRWRRSRTSSRASNRPSTSSPQNCTDNTCKSLGDLRGLVGNLVAQGNGSSPLTLSQNGSTRTLTGGLVLTGVLSALYSRSTWTTLETALQQAKAGTAQGLIDLADNYNERYPDGTYSNLYDSNATISCNDSPPGPTDETVRTTAASGPPRTRCSVGGRLSRCSSASRGSRFAPSRRCPPRRTAT